MGVRGRGSAALPGRQAVLGTPALTLGAYDELLGRIAERRGDLADACRWWEAAREQGVLVGSPHQIALADAHLARTAAVPAPRSAASASMARHP